MSDKYHLYQSAYLFLEEKEKYTVESLLSKGYLFDTFIHRLCGIDMDNATGGSYRKIFLCFYKDGVLLGSHHRNDNDCCIEISSNPKSEWGLGDKDSRYSGNPHPFLKDGEWVEVWNGYDKKLKDGPWVNKVKEVIQYVIDKAKIRSEELINEENKEKEKIEVKRMEFNNNLNKNWSENVLCQL